MEHFVCCHRQGNAVAESVAAGGDVRAFPCAHVVEQDI